MLKRVSHYPFKRWSIKEGVPLPIKRWNVKGLWRGEFFSTFYYIGKFVEWPTITCFVPKGENMAEAKKFGFYTINAEYLKFLYDKDSEVYYNKKYHTLKKPFVGIVIGLGENKYFIPLTSAKEKHKKWKNVSDAHFLIYEFVESSLNIPDHIYKSDDGKKKIHILSVLDIKKMIPVPDGEFEYIDFDKLEDKRYKDLFEKEYAFCLRIKRKILNKAEELYDSQQKSKVIRKMCCNFSKLEKALNEWKIK